MAVPRTRPSRIRIEEVTPAPECGRYAAKATSGDAVEIAATVLCDGHEQVRAEIRHRPPGTRRFRAEPMTRQEGGDRFHGSLPTGPLGWHEFHIRAWLSPFASWTDELRRKTEAGQTGLESELAEGAALLRRFGERLGARPRARALEAAAALTSAAPEAERIEAALSPELGELMEGAARTEATRTPANFEIDVDRERARAGAWYELFPRSFGGLAGVEAALPRLADLGFDVLYLTPIHPIGASERKGANNAPRARKGDPGSPWAIGSAEGGHTAVHPELGTLADVERLVEAARALEIDIALDFAIQCSPDHPWLAEHPEWFNRRPDGTLKYAENPPKRYQDIYNVDFGSSDWRGLWGALRDAVAFWVARGVRVFRVDNPHTKPLAFWEWLIRDIRALDPGVVFLAEAFTRPAIMQVLAKLGFSQSYTYFTWRNSKAELTEYLTELTRPASLEVFRPNFFANTPDILHEYLQTGGPPAFEARLVLAATLSPSYGIYSGFESYERVPAAPGSEEYLDSEKYEIKKRALDGPLLGMVRRLNAARRSRPALLRLDSLAFLETASDHLIGYAKGTGAETVLVCVNLDSHAAREGLMTVPAELGLPARFAVRDVLDDRRYTWSTGPNYVRLEPGVRQAHVLVVEP